MKERVLKSLGIELAEISDRAKAYRILIDSLAYIISITGTKLSVDGVIELLDRIGIRVDKNSVQDLVPYITPRVGKVTYNVIKLYQYEVPRLLSSETRKRLAAYYTGPLGTKIMSSLTRKFIEKTGKSSITIADPFMGSATTLTEAIKSLGIHRIKRVWGIEKHPLACIVAYASLLGVTNGMNSIIDVKCGDSFKIIWGSSVTLDKFFRKGNVHNADVILTNPPFTRWEGLDRDYREFLKRIINAMGYSKFLVRRQVNLQAISLFLMDTILNEGGLLIAVLPASTFYTIYGQGVKTLLREKYYIPAIIQKVTSTFSIDCGFKEVILVAVKQRKYHGKTAFITLEDEEHLNISSLAENIMRVRSDHGVHGYKVSLIDLHKLPYILDVNWLLLFEESKIKQLVVNTIVDRLNEGILILWKDALGKKSIVRGIEMYGPDFFLLPNKYWIIKKTLEDRVIIQNIHTGEELEIDIRYLVLALRRPGLYANRIVVQPDYYFVSIPPKDLEHLPKDIRSYIEWGIKAGTASPAIRSFGRYWYSHVYRQIQTKKPFGYLFLPDKVDATFKNRGVFASISFEKITATKNFYILVNDNRYAPILALWFNSSLFLLLFIYGSRKISETWTRFLENDYLNMPIPNLRIAEDYLEEALSLIDSLKSLTLPPLRHQLYKDYRYEIDELIARILRLHDPRSFVEKLHELLIEVL